MASNGLPPGWDPLKDHYKTSNVYRANKVVTRRDGSESEASEEKEKDIFIANIPSRITTDGLINLLGASGKIQEIRLVPDKRNTQNQLGFVKTFTSADGLRIIEQFNNFRIGNNILKVQVQRPRRTLLSRMMTRVQWSREIRSQVVLRVVSLDHDDVRTDELESAQNSKAALNQRLRKPERPTMENSSDFARPLSDRPFNDRPQSDRPLSNQSHGPLSNQFHGPPASLSSTPSSQPESSAELGQCGPGGRLSSSPFGEEKMKAAGRSKLILATWLRNRSHEPPVGQLGAGATNGLSHHSSQSGSSSSDEHGTRELAKKNDKQPESRRPALERANRPQENPSQASKNVSADKVSPRSQVCRTGPCLKCGNMGDKNCSKCKGIYCSKACQKDDFPFHKLICQSYNRDEDEFQKRFDFFFYDMNERGDGETEARATVLPLNVPTEVIFLVPAITPSRFYVFPKENFEKLKDLSQRLNEYYAVEKNCQKPRNSPDVGDICACQYSGDKLWYRAEVEDVVSRSRVVVRYVDYGNEEEVEISSICELSREFKVIPKLTVLCGLANIEPVPVDGGSTGWSKVAIELSQMVMIVQSCDAMITPVSVISGVCYVEMNINGSDVTEIFVQAGVARYAKKKKDQPLPVSSSTPQLPSPRPSLSPNQLPSSRPSPNQLPLSRPSPTQLSSSRPSPNDLSSSTPLPHAKRTPAASPSMAELNFITSPNLSSYGWPADLSTLVGTEMSFQVVEYSPPGDLWVRINPLPGRETVPLVRLSLTDRYRLTPEPRPSSSCSSNHASLTAEAVLPAEPKWHRLTIDDLPPLQLGTELKVEVTFPKNLADFWCHDLVQMAPVIDLQTSLRPSGASPLPNSFQPEKGDICFGLYKKYGEWYRVLVSERKRDSVEAFLIDYGESVSIALNDLRPLPLELSLYPPMAFQCQLSVWSSLQTSSSFIVQRFRDLVESKVVVCKVLAQNPATGMRSVALSDFESGQSIASVLIDAMERNGL